MKKYLLFFFNLILVSQLCGQDSTSYVMERSDPGSVVNAIFYAAGNNDFSVLEGLCDPERLGDDDSKMICALCDLTVSKESTLNFFISDSGTKYEGASLETAKKEMKEFLANWKMDFVNIFKNGKINGEIKYANGIEGAPDLPAALVPIQYHDKKGSEVDDFALLIKRDNSWYLFGL